MEGLFNPSLSLASVMPCNGSVPRIDFGGLGDWYPPSQIHVIKMG